MLGKEIYKIWAPEGNLWTNWIRPVPFIELDNEKNNNSYYDFTIPDINWINNYFYDSVIFIDLPANYSVAYGIALLDFGFWPIPIFNGTLEPENSIPTTDNHVVEKALLWGANILKDKKINSNMLPAFLLDCSRTNTYKMNETIFDNSWDIYSQDIPSQEFFKEKGINKIVIIGEEIQRDLKKILYKFQKSNFDIYITNGYNDPKKIKLRKDFIEFFIKEV